jgi:hypothetical protein
MEVDKLVIARDQHGHWFIRGDITVVEDWTKGLRVYKCETHLAGPLKSLKDVEDWITEYDCLNK